EWVKASIDSGAPGPRLVAFVMQASIWGAAAALPLMIWVIYLYLAYWGIIDDYQAASGAHTPTWLLAMANAVSSRVFDFLGYTLPESVSLRLADRPIIVLYLCVALVLILLSWLIRPNANSLHGAYRDRLGRAFLFDPGEVNAKDQKDSDELRPLEMRLSQLSVTDAPYHLIGASLNIQGSLHANRRARNADFFLFSPLYVGSHVTGWAPTKRFERAARDVDL